MDTEITGYGATLDLDNIEDATTQAGPDSLRASLLRAYRLRRCPPWWQMAGEVLAEAGDAARARLRTRDWTAADVWMYHRIDRLLECAGVPVEVQEDLL